MNRDQCVVVDGESSSYIPVQSGVPQGSVLGPLLFLLHINDLPNEVDHRTSVRLFADDCLVYRTINTVGLQDQITLQDDLNRLELWSNKWGMKFHAQKCNIMRISRTQQPLSRMYTLCGHVLQQTDKAKYLGITIFDNLDWSVVTPHTISVSQI